MNSKPFKHNALLCLECNRVLVSFWRHHFTSCDCPNKAFADGGFDYFRYGAKDLKLVRHLYLLSIEPADKVKKMKRKAKKK